MTLVDFNPAQAMGEEISRVLSVYKQEEKPVLLFLSGGTAFSPLEYIPPKMLSGMVTLTTLDERYAPSGLNSNFVALSRTSFFKNAQMEGVQVIDTCVLAGESQKELADRIDADVRAWMIEHPNGVLLAVAGVGADGHTAGMMPYPEDRVKFAELFEGERLFVAYDASGKNQFPLRVTATMTLLRKLNHAFLYARGEEKREALRRMKAEGVLAECPARIFQEIPTTLYSG